MRLCRRRFGTVIGLALALGGVLQYESENASLFGRWSVPLFAFAGFLALVWIWTLTRALKAPKSPTTGVVDLLRVVLIEAGMLVWGTAYFVAAMDSPSAGANLLSANLFGSAVPVAVVLHFVAIALFFGAAVTFLPRLADRWQQPALLVMGIVLGLLIAEGWVRLRALLLPVTQGFPTYTSALWERRYVQWNASGFRDAERNLASDTRIGRILLVGDSYVFGTGIRRPEHRLGEQLASLLNARATRSWEVINAGRPDRHTLHEMQTLRCMLQYRPDVVILIYVFNDIDYLRPVTIREGLSEAPRGLIQRVHPSRLLYANSFLFQELYLRLRAVTLGRQDRHGERDPYADAALLSAHLRDVRTFQEIAQSAGADVLVVPFDIGIAEDQWLLTRYRNFVSEARRMGIAIASLESTFANQEYDGLYVNALDRHPNESAHRLAAEAIAPLIASRASLAEGRNRTGAVEAAPTPRCEPQGAMLSSNPKLRVPGN